MGSDESVSTTFSEMSSVMGDADNSAHRAKIRLFKKKLSDRDKKLAERDTQLKSNYPCNYVLMDLYWFYTD